MIEHVDPPVTSGGLLGWRELFAAIGPAIEPSTSSVSAMEAVRDELRSIPSTSEAWEIARTSRSGGMLGRNAIYADLDHLVRAPAPQEAFRVTAAHEEAVLSETELALELSAANTRAQAWRDLEALNARLWARHGKSPSDGLEKTSGPTASFRDTCM